MDKYRIGDRVQLHPATDAWMSGDKYGTITRVGSRFYSVRMDKSGSILTVAEADIVEVVEKGYAGWPR